MPDCLDVALSYAARGKSVIPVSPRNKQPLVPWTPFQSRVATEEEITSWWDKNPDANVGLVCGAISGVLVVDCDSEEATSRIQEILPESLAVPLQSTPGGGRHFFFAYQVGYGNKVRVAPGVDIRTQGGFVVMSPSSDDRGSWEWVGGNDLFSILPPAIPRELSDFLSKTRVPWENQASYNNKELYIYKDELQRGAQPRGAQGRSGGAQGNVDKLVEGSRNDTVFRMLCSDRRRGLRGSELLDQARVYAKACTPLLSNFEVEKIWKSVLQYKDPERCSEDLVKDEHKRELSGGGAQEALRRRSDQENIGSRAALSLWLSEIGSAKFTLRDAYENAGAYSAGDRGSVRSQISKLREAGRVIRLKGKGSEFRAIRQDIIFSPYKNVKKPTEVDLWFPLDIHHKARIFEKNHIVVSGTTGQGKTTFLLSMIRENQFKYPCFYYGSEMTAGEISYKINHMTDVPLEHWSMKFMKKDDWSYIDIPDVIGSSPNGIHFVDYLSPDDEKYYNIGEKMMECTEKLEHGVIIFSVQHNNPNSPFGIGGGFSAHGAVLYINIGFNKLYLAKVRAAEEDPSPNLRTRDFKYFRGIYTPDGPWYDARDKKVKSTIYERGDTE